MMRMFGMERVVCGDYMRQLLAIAVVVTFCISLGMQTIVAAPAIVVAMYMMMGTIAFAAYDEQSGWGAYRMTMPLSRRDVVCGRYVSIVFLGLVGLVLALACALIIAAVVTVLPAGGELGAGFALTTENVAGMIAAGAVCLLLGAVVSSVITPIYLRFGATKSTGYIPLVAVGLYLVPLFLINSGIVDGNVFEVAAKSMIDLLSTPVGMALFTVGALAIVAVVLGISLAVSIKLYVGRDL